MLQKLFEIPQVDFECPKKRLWLEQPTRKAIKGSGGCGGCRDRERLFKRRVGLAKAAGE